MYPAWAQPKKNDLCLFSNCGETRHRAAKILAIFRAGVALLRYSRWTRSLEVHRVFDSHRGPDLAMDRRSFVSSVSVLGVGAALTDMDRLASESHSVAAPRFPTLPRTNIAL
jgi:hypothetical protein